MSSRCLVIQNHTSRAVMGLKVKGQAHLIRYISAGGDMFYQSLLENFVTEGNTKNTTRWIRSALDKYLMRQMYEFSH